MGVPRRGAEGAAITPAGNATVVCVLAALLVFGMLVWSTIPVLRAIGLTVALGVAFHFCLSILMAPHARKARSDDG